MPVVAAIVAFVLGDRSALRPLRVVGIAVGLSGVGLLVGRDLGRAAGPPWWSVAEVLIVVLCYATAPFIASRQLTDVPSLGVISVALTTVAIVYAPSPVLSRPECRDEVGGGAGWRYRHGAGSSCSSASSTRSGRPALLIPSPTVVHRPWPRFLDGDTLGPSPVSCGSTSDALSPRVGDLPVPADPLVSNCHRAPRRARRRP